MQNKRKDLSERLLDFAAGIIKLLIRLNKTAIGLHIGNQLMRSATSSGANYEEACGAESKADFIHKMQLVLKELRESLYWLKLATRAGLISNDDLQPLLSEAEELVKIVAKSIIT
ncbi:MAG TPA: four helix bundle protein, partial [Methanophagales archaeon]|nr:four helix bundle protein [Methanophagales archaeon]